MPLPSFSTYLVPSLPFRRRQSSADSTTSAGTSTTATGTSPPTEQTYLSSSSSHLRCGKCLTDLALSSQIISKGFTGRHGRAYLVAPSSSSIPLNVPTFANAKVKNSALPNLPNTFTERPVPRQLVTGAHTVSDIHCAQCGLCLGWKYVAAEEDGQKYKVGKFILETKRVCRSTMWEMDEDDQVQFAVNEALALKRRRSSAVPPDQLPSMSSAADTAVPEEIEFDSQDEEECEDLFLGVWTPQSAARRRRAKKLVG